MTYNTDQKSRFDCLFTKRIVLFGAGITGTETYKILDNYFYHADVAYFCDTYKSGRVSGLPVISPEELKVLLADTSWIVIVTALSNNHKEIIGWVESLGVARSRIYSLFEFNDLVIANIDDHRIDAWYRSIKKRKAMLPNDQRRSVYQNWWCPEHYCDKDILVYQPGKVGSSSICNSLYAAGINATHVHMLTDSFIYDLIPELAWEPSAAESKIIRECMQICNDRIKSADGLKIITLVREPLSRDFSHFLYHMNELVDNGVLFQDSSIEEICANGIKKRATQNGKCRAGYQFEWFEKELKKVFGIDVYDHVFDKEKGYSVIKNGKIEVLLVKLEKLDSLETVIGQFVNRSELKLIKSNEASKKSYYSSYKSLRERVKLSEELVSLYYSNNRFMDHFYDEEEKRLLLKNWRNNISD